MFCPYCGVSNDRGEGKCFVCEKQLPSLAAAAPAAAAAGSGRPRPEKRGDTAQPVFASVGDRLIALVFDRIIVASLLLVIAAWAADHWSGYRFQSATWAAIAITGTVFLTTFLYHFLSEAAFLTTVGKAAMGLHVGVEPGRSRVAGSAIRNILRVIDGIGIYLVGFLFATFTRRRQRVGDLAGRTFVLEWPIGRGGRAAMMFLMIVIAAAAVWTALALCPACSSQIPDVRAIR
jgi:uncharacterized RDD family membrane protein YckC